ncbi:MAG: hypothetical protein K2N46_02560 [Lachnospiraceae bacterium]|nr:hypothetical protein [Lachnospiraceae bacterium]
MSTNFLYTNGKEEKSDEQEWRWCLVGNIVGEKGRRHYALRILGRNKSDFRPGDRLLSDAGTVR